MKKYKDFFKSIAIVLITQAVMYFLIKSFISNYNTLKSIMTFPFIKSFVYFYDSWYPFVFLTSFIIYKHDKEAYYKLIFTIIISTIMAHITFIIYPSEVLRPSIEVHNITDFILDFTYKTDTPAVNCLPSVHCLYCFNLIFYIIKCNNLKNKFKLPIVTYLILIILSTLFIYQHVIEDVVLALIYSVITIVITHKFNDKLKDLLKFIF